VARRKNEGKKNQILEAAIEVFAEKGFYETRISDIAHKAGVAYGLVYHYFKNKEEILRTIFLERWSVVLEMIESALASTDEKAEDRLAGILSFIFTVYQRDPALAEVVVLEVLHGEAFLKDEVLRGFQRAFSGITEIVRQGQTSGEFRKDFSPDLLTLAYFGGAEVLLSASALKVVDLARVDPQEFARAFVDLLVRGAGGRRSPIERG